MATEGDGSVEENVGELAHRLAFAMWGATFGALGRRVKEKFNEDMATAFVFFAFAEPLDYARFFCIILGQWFLWTAAWYVWKELSFRHRAKAAQCDDFADGDDSDWGDEEVSG